MTGYRQLARNRDFTILWVGETISELGSTMSLFVYPLIAFHLTGSTLVAAALEAAALLGLCATLLPAGVLADRHDRQKLMFAASLAGALLYGSLVVAGVMDQLTVPHLFVVALLGGVCTGVFQPAMQASIPTVVSTEELPTAFSQNQARQHIASLLGGPLGGVLYAVRAWAPFAVDAASYLVSCLTVSRIRTDLRPPERTGEPVSVRTHLVQGFRFVWDRPFFRVLLVWSTQTNLLVNACFFAVAMRLVREGYPAAAIGLVSTCAGIGGILGALAAPAVIERFRTGTLTAVVAWMCVLPLVPLIWWSTPAGACVAIFLLLLMNPAGNAGIGSYRAAMTPTELQGRVGSAMQFTAMSVMPVAPLLGGWLLATIGGQQAIAVLVALSGAVALVPTLSRAIRAVPRPSEWSATQAGPMSETVGEMTGATCV